MGNIVFKKEGAFERQREEFQKSFDGEIRTGDFVKTQFLTQEHPFAMRETMWVKVIKAEEKVILGELNNNPIGNGGEYYCGKILRIDRRRICDYLNKNDKP